MRAEFPAIQKPNKQKIFYLRNKASSSSSSNKLMNKMLWRCEQAICLRNLFEAEVCVESLFAFGDNVVGLWLWGLVAACYILKRHQTHTRLFALQHPTLGKQNGWRSGRVINGGEDSLFVNNNPIQDHPSPSPLVDDWPNKPLTGLLGCWARFIHLELLFSRRWVTSCSRVERSIVTFRRVSRKNITLFGTFVLKNEIEYLYCFEPTLYEEEFHC